MMLNSFVSMGKSKSSSSIIPGGMAMTMQFIFLTGDRDLEHLAGQAQVLPQT